MNLVNTRDKLLEFLDDEIIDALSYHLRERGVLHPAQRGVRAASKARDDGVVLHLKSGKQLKTDILLWANGRTGNTDDLGLENDRHRARQPRPDRGQRALSDRRMPHIYAVGDVIGFPVAGQRRVRSGPLRRQHISAAIANHRLVAGHSHRHLHQPRDQLARQDRAAS